MPVRMNRMKQKLRQGQPVFGAGRRGGAGCPQEGRSPGQCGNPGNGAVSSLERMATECDQMIAVEGARSCGAERAEVVWIAV